MVLSPDWAYATGSVRCAVLTIRCPSCKERMALTDSRVGAMGVCPSCGLKFRIAAASRANGARVPAAAATPVRSGRKARPADEPIEEESVVEIDEDPPEAAEAEEEEPATAGDGTSATAGGESPEAADEADDEAGEKPKKKKKKKKRKRQVDFDPSKYANYIMAGVLLGIGLLVGAGYLLFAHRGPGAPPDPTPALERITFVGGSVQRDAEGNVVGVDLAGREFKSSDMALLKAFPKLKRLNLTMTVAGDVSYSQLEGLTEIEELNLSRSRASDQSMPYLRNMKKLRKLDVSGTFVSDKGLENLMGITTLQELNVIESHAKGYELERAIPGLKVYRE